MINEFNSISISNSIIAFFGKKCDLAVYSITCDDNNNDIIKDEESILGYHIYIENSKEERDSLLMLLGNTNVSSSKGIAII